MADNVKARAKVWLDQPVGTFSQLEIGKSTEYSGLYKLPVRK